jgi:hypothetical protein
MMNHTSALLRLIDIEEIRGLIYRYFRAVDDSDVGGTLGCFAEDVRQEWDGGVTVIEGLAPMAEWVRKHAEARTVQTHLAGNIDVTVDGDTAHAETTVLGFILADQEAELAGDPELPDKDTLRACGGVFSDDLVRTPDGWKITHRRHRAYWKYEVESLDTTPEARTLSGLLGADPPGAAFSGRPAQ